MAFLCCSGLLQAVENKGKDLGPTQWVLRGKSCMGEGGKESVERRGWKGEVGREGGKRGWKGERGKERVEKAGDDCITEEK